MPDISIWKTDNLENMKDIFEGCNSLTLFLPDIQKWNLNKIKNKKETLLSDFSQCFEDTSHNLLSLNSDIKKGNHSNICFDTNSDNKVNEGYNVKNFPNNTEIKERSEINIIDDYFMAKSDDTLVDYYENFY